MATEFSYFARLPLELRRMIWKFCIPRRVVEINTSAMGYLPIPSSCNLYWTAIANNRPPIITRVCKESRSVAMETGGLLPTDPDFSRNTWLDQQHDTLALYWDPDHYPPGVGFRDDVYPWPFFHEHAIQNQPVLIAAQSIYGFHYFDRTPVPVAVSDLLDYSREQPDDELADISSWKSYLICLSIVTLHMTAEQAFRSQLFGATGEELVKLVDPMDTERIQRFSDECNPDDKKAKEFFNLALETENFHRHLEPWRREIVFYWIWLKWYDAQESEDIWIGPSAENKRYEVMRLVDTSSADQIQLNMDPFSSADQIQLNMDLYTPNMDHPWVKAVLDEMPTFQPTIMFRLCVSGCYKIPEIDEDVRRMEEESIHVAQTQREIMPEYRRVPNPEYTKQKMEQRRVEREVEERAKPERRKMQRR